MQFENAIPARTKGLLGACLFLRFYLGLKNQTLPSASRADRNSQRFCSHRWKVKRIANPLLTLWPQDNLRHSDQRVPRQKQTPRHAPINRD